MATRLRLEDRLDGARNFVPWKARLVLILEENELWDEVVYNTTANPIIRGNLRSKMGILRKIIK